jgi:lysophospholipase L1-like esterase
MGLRTSGHTDAWRSIPRRVLIMGDSFAFGWGVEGEEMVSARLQEALAARDVQAAVLSGGVPGYSTDQEYLLWQQLEPKVHPQVAVVLISGNDPPADRAASVNMSGAIYSKPFFRVAGAGLELHGVPVPDKQPLPSSSSSLEPVKARFRPLAAYALVRQFISSVRSSPAPDGETVSAVDMLSVTGAILAAFNRDLRARGGQLLVVLIPSPDVREAVARICGEEGIRFLDLGPAFAGHPDLTFKYDGHWNARGHQAAANAVLPVIMEMLK